MWWVLLIVTLSILAWLALTVPDTAMLEQLEVDRELRSMTDHRGKAMSPEAYQVLYGKGERN